MNWRLLAGGALVLALVAALAFVLANGDEPAPTTTTLEALPSTTVVLTTPPSTTAVPSTTTVPPTTTIVPPEDRFQPSDIDVFSDEVPVLDLRIHEFTDEEFERILEVHLEFQRWLGLHPELTTEEVIELVAVRDTDYWDTLISSWQNDIEKGIHVDGGSFDFVATTPLVNGIPTDQVPDDIRMIELATAAVATTDFVVTDALTGEILAVEPPDEFRIEGSVVLSQDDDEQWKLSVLS